MFTLTWLIWAVMYSVAVTVTWNKWGHVCHLMMNSHEAVAVLHTWNEICSVFQLKQVGFAKCDFSKGFRCCFYSLSVTETISSTLTRSPPELVTSFISFVMNRQAHFLISEKAQETHPTRNEINPTTEEVWDSFSQMWKRYCKYLCHHPFIFFTALVVLIFSDKFVPTVWLS